MPERRRIRLIGIGGGNGEELTVSYLRELCGDVENRRKPEAMEKLLESVSTAEDCRRIREACLADDMPFRELFAGRFYAFRTALEDYYAPSADHTDRLNYMAGRLCDEIARDSGGKYLGYIGAWGFTDALKSYNPSIYAKLYRGLVLYDGVDRDGSLYDGPADEDGSWFGLAEEGIYVTDNRFFRCFEAWRKEVVCRLSGLDTESYARKDDPDMLLIFVS